MYYFVRENIFFLLFSLLEVVNTLVYIDQFINNICVKNFVMQTFIVHGF